MRIGRIINEEELFQFVNLKLETTPKINVSILQRYLNLSYCRLCLTSDEIVSFFSLIDRNFSIQQNNYSLANRFINGTPVDPIYLMVTKKPVLPVIRNSID